MLNVINFPKIKPPFEVGDVVTLKSGGPACLVTYCDINNVTYNWFNEQGELEKDTSPCVCLQLLLSAPICDEEGMWSNCLRGL